MKELVKKYLKDCSRASENERLTLIDLGRSFSKGVDGYKKDVYSALWCFAMADFEDPAYYNELGREPLPAAAYNARWFFIDELYSEMNPFERFYFNRVFSIMYKYLGLVSFWPWNRLIK